MWSLSARRQDEQSTQARGPRDTKTQEANGRRVQLETQRRKFGKEAPQPGKPQITLSGQSVLWFRAQRTNSPKSPVPRNQIAAERPTGTNLRRHL